MIHDISRPLETNGPHWPGDTPTAFSFVARLKDGAAVNLGQLTMSVHNGTHLDAPYHYDDSGATIEQLPLDLGVGPALVVDARGKRLITPEVFEGIDLASTPRVLFRTDAWPVGTSFPEVWPLLEPVLPDWLAGRGVRLLGVDVPSVDALTSETLPIHDACRAAGVAIMENLDLSAITPGRYELIALPLRLTGADGSPVRAVLRSCED